MAKIQWLTQEHIQQQGKKSRKAALECGIEHWFELWQAKPQELESAMNFNLTSIGSFHCALCKRYFPNCGKCPFYGSKNEVCGPHNEWHLAYEAFYGWRHNLTHSNWLKWKKAAKATFIALLKVHKKHYLKTKNGLIILMRRTYLNARNKAKSKCN